MIKCDKSNVGINGDAKTIMSEFLTLASAVYEEVYVRVYEDKAKEKYFDQITLTTLKDEELIQTLGEKEQSKLEQLKEIKKQLEKLLEEKDED